MDVSGARRSSAESVIAEQVLRSSGSIGANTAEGSNRTQSKFANALDIALGEANETENWLYKLRDVGALPKETADERLRTVIDIEKTLRSLRSEILRNQDAVRETDAEYVSPGGWRRSRAAGLMLLPQPCVIHEPPPTSSGQANN